MVINPIISSASGRVYKIILPVSNWSNGSQTASVQGAMPAGQATYISPVTASDAEAWAVAGIKWSSNSANTLTFTYKTAPAADIAVNVMLINNTV